jgi:hypothetical protein
MTSISPLNHPLISLTLLFLSVMSQYAALVDVRSSFLTTHTLMWFLISPSKCLKEASYSLMGSHSSMEDISQDCSLSANLALRSLILSSTLILITISIEDLMYSITSLEFVFLSFSLSASGLNFYEKIITSSFFLTLRLKYKSIIDSSKVFSWVFIYFAVLFYYILIKQWN